MLDPRVPGSPDWWLNRLIDKQNRRLPQLRKWCRYFEGDHDRPEGDRDAQEVFRQFQNLARSNYTGLVGESVVERARPIGFRAGGDVTAETDADAWRMWQANSMDADVMLAIRAAVAMGESYLLVGPPDGTARDQPVITAEDPREMIVELDPVRHRRVIAALKIWVDEIRGEKRAVLYLQDEIHSYVAPVTDPSSDAPFLGASLEKWEPAGSVRNPLGRPPVARIPNRPDLYGNTRAEFADVIDIQDRINSQILDRLVVSKMQAYRQRWVTGAVFEDEDGKPLDPFVPGADKVWAVEDPEAKFGDFTQADVRPILEAQRSDVRDLAAVSRTPPHYLMGGDFSNAGGDAFAQSETGHVAKVGERIAHYGEGIEDAIRLGFGYLGDPRATQLDSEVIWADPQYRSLSEKADAAVKLGAAGVPWNTLMVSVLGYTPQQVQRMAAERSQDALLLNLLAQPQGGPDA